MAPKSSFRGARWRELEAQRAEMRDHLRAIRLARRRHLETERDWRPENVGKRKTSVYVLLRLMTDYGVNTDLLILVSKLLLPHSAWSPVGKPIGWTWAEQLQVRMAKPKVQSLADVIWANRCAPEHRRLIRKVKRLVAESYVFQNIVELNHKGTTPKRHHMVTLLRKVWPRSDVGTDRLLQRLDLVHVQRHWAERFRSFWKVSWGKLPVRGALTLEQQSDKVWRPGISCRLGLCTQIWGHIWYPFLGTSYTDLC